MIKRLNQQHNLEEEVADTGDAFQGKELLEGDMTDQEVNSIITQLINY